MSDEINDDNYTLYSTNVQKPPPKLQKGSFCVVSVVWRNSEDQKRFFKRLCVEKKDAMESLLTTAEIEAIIGLETSC